MPVIRPQRGPQETFLSSKADVAIAGGAAGGGKTWSLLLEPLRHLKNRRFGAVIFRRTIPQITNQGGLWDEAMELYSMLGAKPNGQDHFFKFESGMKVRFAHMQHVKDAKSWSGSQIPFIGYDQLEEFEEDQFWFLTSRARSAIAGVRPYIRATCNPVPDDDKVGGWLNKLISWWIDQDTGYAIPDRSGVLRWFVRRSNDVFWGDTREEMVERFPGSRPKSLTFIPALLSDNKVLEVNDPDYRAWLEGMPLVDRERLLNGNWKIKASAGKVFNRAWFKEFHAVEPKEIRRWVRYWDKAGTQGGGKYSAGVLLGQREDNGKWLIADVVRGQWSAHNRETIIKQTANADHQLGRRVTIWIEQEPGSGGKESAENTVLNLGGFEVRVDRVSGDKVTRAGPLSAQAEAGNIELMQRPWTEAWLNEAQNFDGEHGYMDQVDASSGAFNKLTLDVPQYVEEADVDWG
jgi:predicted phage terminase large subunit-like protein